MGKKRSVKITFTFGEIIKSPNTVNTLNTVNTRNMNRVGLKETKSKLEAKTKEVQAFQEMRARLRPAHPDRPKAPADYQKGWVNGVPPKKTFY